MDSGSFSPLGFQPQNQRRLLLVSPRYSHSFGTFNHTFPLMGVRAFMPPQGLLLIAAMLPSAWEIRFVDENVHPAAPDDFEWADAVMTSGMHIQKPYILDIARRAHAYGRPVVLGGPSVSAAPGQYPGIDYLHRGEIGDATLDLLKALDQSCGRPQQQQSFTTRERIPLRDFPFPAYDLIDIRDYLLGSVQFSSGCPFTCEFCDIPALYGRRPRLKDTGRIIDELDRLADGGAVSVYFVDDNFIANPKAAMALLPELVTWQKKRDYQVRLSCEATLNITRYPRIMELMRDAFFTNIFIGIETPEVDAIRAMKKPQNLHSPLVESVATLNRYGMEVASGIIVGLDSDHAGTVRAITEFAEHTNIPIMTVNLLYALPGTPLHDRLQKAGRLLPEAECEGRDSNIEFLQPYAEVVADWKRIIGEIYTPQNLYRRYLFNARHTYPHRRMPKYPARQATPENLARAVAIFVRIVREIGLRGSYRRDFWRMAAGQLAQGKVETMFQVSMVAHHLITYARECIEDRTQASNYSLRTVERE